MAISWQEYVREEAGKLGLDVSSGYRSPAHNRAIGGAPGSYHTRGSSEAPGAIDVAGPAAQLRELFSRIRAAFEGRINELYLNIPGGRSEAIRRNVPITSNPEAGRPQHLHIAIGNPPGTVYGPGGVPAYSRLPLSPEEREARERTASGNECVRSLCPPDLKGIVARALGREPEPQTNCVCWSDIWVYGAGVVLIVGGSWVVFLARGGE